KAMAYALTRQADRGLDQSAVAALRKVLRGPLLQPAEPGYDEARTIWNVMITKRPALIARVSGNADVIACVNFARENGLPWSVRGGGHNVAGTALCDGGLMIDMSLRRGVRVDPTRRIVCVEGGATWGDVDHETQPFGLVVPSGIVSNTGVAGFTMGGGFGWTSRKFGYAADNLISVDIVTADGELRLASDTQNPDLFWALRGAAATSAPSRHSSSRRIGTVRTRCAAWGSIRWARYARSCSSSGKSPLLRRMSSAVS